MKEFLILFALMLFGLLMFVFGLANSLIATPIAGGMLFLLGAAYTCIRIVRK